jgi:hypothetical protein
MLLDACPERATPSGRSWAVAGEHRASGSPDKWTIPQVNLASPDWPRALISFKRVGGPTVRSRSCLKGSSRKGFYLAPGWWSIQRSTPYAQVHSHVQKEPPRGLSGTPKRPRADSVEGR